MTETTTATQRVAWCLYDDMTTEDALADLERLAIRLEICAFEAAKAAEEVRMGIFTIRRIVTERAGS